MEPEALKTFEVAKYLHNKTQISETGAHGLGYIENTLCL